MTNRLGININANAATHWDWIHDYLARAKPSVMLIMNDYHTALELAQQYTDTRIIYRHYAMQGISDKSQWEKLTPQQYVNEAKRYAPDTSVLWHVDNEPNPNLADLPAYIDHTIKRIRLLVEAGYTPVVGNFASGTWQKAHIKAELYDPLLKEIARWRDRGRDVYLGVHEYSVGIAAAGTGLWQLDGKYTSATMDDIKRSTYANPTRWPDRLPVGKNTYPDYWHIGRCLWFLQRADKLSIPRPRIIVTEGTHDKMNDVSAVYDELYRMYGAPAPFSELKGHMTYENVYNALWRNGADGLTFQQWLAEQFWWHANRVYPSEVIGVTPFQWTTNDLWVNYGHSLIDNDIWSHVMSKVQAQDTPQYPAPLPDAEWELRRIVSMGPPPERTGWDAMNVRMAPGTNAERASFELHENDAIWIEPERENVTEADGWQWRRVRILQDGKTHWVASNALALDPVKPDGNTGNGDDAEEYVTVEEMNAAIEAARADMYQQMADIADAMKDVLAAMERVWKVMQEGAESTGE